MPNTSEEAWKIIQAQNEQIKLLEEQIKYLTQKRFGQSSEKVDDPNQLSIFEDTDNTSVFTRDNWPTNRNYHLPTQKEVITASNS